MATITFYNWTTGETLDAADLNGNFAAIKTLIETDKLDLTNLNKTKAINTIPFYFDSLSGSATAVCNVRVPAGLTYEFVDLSLSIDSGGASSVISVDFKDNAGDSLLSSLLTQTGPGENFVSTFESPSGSDGDVLSLELTHSGSGSSDDVTVILTVKAELTD
jgi:hypothetical protein